MQQRVDSWLRMVCLAGLGILAVPGQADGATITARNGNPHHVQAAIRAAQHGDLVLVPPGTYVWTEGVSWRNKAITLGLTNVVIVDEAVQRNKPLIDVVHSTDAWGFVRITGGEFRGGTRNTGNNYVGLLRIGGGGSLYRLDHLTWTRPNGRPGTILDTDRGFGLMDHCRFHLDQSGWALWGTTRDMGHRSWATPVTFGATNTGFYMESCIVTNDKVNKAFLDGFSGARYVARSNIFLNASVQNHGTESSGKFRGTRYMASYRNRFGAHIKGEFAHFFRSGTGDVHDNVVQGAGFPGLSRMATYRHTDPFAPWGQANGTNPWDKNAPGGPFASGQHDGGNGAAILRDSQKRWKPNRWVGYSILNLTSGKAGMIKASTANTILSYGSVKPVNRVTWKRGDRYQVWRVDRALDQPGAGQGKLLSGGNNQPPRPARPVGWPEQETDPIHFWNNSGNTNVVPSPYSTIDPDEDFRVNQRRPGYTTLAFPHPYIALTETPGE